jgi:hypothetical protein
MPLFEVQGIDDDHVGTAVGAYVSILAYSSASVLDVCAGVFSTSIDALRSVVDESAIRHASYFAWWYGNVAEFAQHPNVKLLEAAEMQLDNIWLSISESRDEVPLDYDWNELRPETVVLAFERHACDTSPASIESCRDFLAEVIDQSGTKCERPLHVATIHRESTVGIVVSAVILKKRVVDVLRTLLQEYRTQEMVSSLHLEGEFDDIKAVASSGEYRTNGYPLGHAPLGVYHTPFAVEPRVLDRAVPNCTLEQAQSIVARAWNLQDHVVACILSRDFLSWPLGDGARSPRTRGNCCRLVVCDKRIRLQVGIEQYSDSDPSVKDMLRSLRRQIKEIGGELRRM